jgi:hypothetical protein
MVVWVGKRQHVKGMIDEWAQWATLPLRWNRPPLLLVHELANAGMLM